MRRPPRVLSEGLEQCTGRSALGDFVGGWNPGLNFEAAVVFGLDARAQIERSLFLRDVEMRIVALGVRLPESDDSSRQGLAVGRAHRAREDQHFARLIFAMRHDARR